MSYIYEQNDSIFYYEESNQKFNLLYSNDWQVNDTIELEHWLDEIAPNFYDSTFYIRIDSVGSFMLDTLELKKIYVSYDLVDASSFNFEDFAPEVLIEGIGSLRTFFHFGDYLVCDGSHNFELRCFSHPIYGDVEFVDYDCDTIITITNVEDNWIKQEPKITISPNPFNEVISISHNEVKGKVTIMLLDIDGRMKYREETVLEENTKKVINTSDLRESIYMFMMLNEDGEVLFVKKVLKIK